MSASPLEIFRYETLDSTNEEAKRLLSAGQIQTLTAILAQEQTAGKGTHGRQWVSPNQAGIYLSVVHPFSESESEQVPLTPLFTLAAGVACAETLRETANLSVQLKPINDLYIEQKKLGGILTESIIQQGRFKALITGIGINIYPAEIELKGSDHRGVEPVCLQQCLEPQVFQKLEMDELIQTLVISVDFWHQQAFVGNHAFLLERYMQYKLPGIELPSAIASGLM